MTESEFFGRTGELEVLDDALRSSRAEMAIVYGRRRVGKTALIQKFLKDKEAFFYTARSWKDEYQLEMFSESLGRRLGNAGQRFTSWTAAIQAYAAMSAENRRILVIDEFQYIAQERPSILSELQAAWDESLSKENFLLILCGSAVSFIAKEVLGEKNPLYGRARTIMKVRPLEFKTVAQFLPEHDVDDLFKGYAVLGGMPYYWQFLNPARSMEENLAQSLMRANGFLNDEAQSLLRQEFREPATYNAILRAIAMGASSRSEIAQKSLVESRILSKYLAVLEEMDLVEREFPVFADPGDLGNSARGRFRLNDASQKFWFRFLADAPVLSLTREEALLTWQELVKPAFAEFAADAFEHAAKEYLLRKRLEGKLPGALAYFGRWWFRDSEIDIVGADKSRRICIAAECKYRSEPAGMKVLRALEKKCLLLPVHEEAEFHYWIFSRKGFDERLLEESRRNPNVHLVPMEALLD